MTEKLPILSCTSPPNLWVRNHSYFHTQAHNSLNFLAIYIGLHDFGNWELSHLFTKNSTFLSINKWQSCTIPGCILQVWAHPCLERKPYLSYVVGVCIPIPSERKPCASYVVGVGSLLALQEAASFLYMLHIVRVTTPMLFWNSYEKSMGTDKYIYWNAYMKTMGVWRPTKYFMYISRWCIAKVNTYAERDDHVDKGTH